MRNFFDLNFTPEQRRELAAILHEVARRAALIRARRLGGCSLAATDAAAGMPDRDDVVAASDEPLSEAAVVTKGE